MKPYWGKLALLVITSSICCVVFTIFTVFTRLTSSSEQLHFASDCLVVMSFALAPIYWAGYFVHGGTMDYLIKTFENPRDQQNNGEDPLKYLRYNRFLLNLGKIIAGIGLLVMAASMAFLNLSLSYLGTKIASVGMWFVCVSPVFVSIEQQTNNNPFSVLDNEKDPLGILDDED